MIRIIKSRSYGMDLFVLYDGKYYFIDNFNGLVAIAERDGMNAARFDVQMTSAIETTVIKAAINRLERQMHGSKDIQVDYVFNRVVDVSTGQELTGDLPYNVWIATAAR